MTKTWSPAKQASLMNSLIFWPHQVLSWPLSYLVEPCRTECLVARRDWCQWRNPVCAIGCVRGITAEILLQRGMILHQSQDLASSIFHLDCWLGVDLDAAWWTISGHLPAIRAGPSAKDQRSGSRIRNQDQDQDQGSRIEDQNQSSPSRRWTGRDASLNKLLEAENVSRDHLTHVAL